MFKNLAILFFVTVFVYVFGTALIGRVGYFRKINIYFRIAGLGILTTPVIWVCRLYLSGSVSEFIIFDSLTYLGLGVLFSYFICLPDRALTLRILVEIYEAKTSGLRLDELNSRFSLAKMIQSRLVQMEKGDVLSVNSEGKILLHTKGKRIGSLVLLGRKFFNIGSAN